MCGRPSSTLLIRVAGTPDEFKKSAVPSVARILKPISVHCCAAPIKSGLSWLRTDIKIVPSIGSTAPPPICDFAKARPKSTSKPIASPVDFISGPNKMSTPGNLANGNTASLTAI